MSLTRIKRRAHKALRAHASSRCGIEGAARSLLSRPRKPPKIRAEVAEFLLAQVSPGSMRRSLLREGLAWQYEDGVFCEKGRNLGQQCDEAQVSPGSMKTQSSCEKVDDGLMT
jgi:hypothetical protein